jgi:hypothetical protein
MGRADFDAKRHLLENVCLNLALDGATLYLQRRKIFDSLIEALPLEKSRGNRIRTCGLLVPNQALYQAELCPGISPE